MRKPLLLLSCLLFNFTSKAVNITPVIISNVPQALPEASGLSYRSTSNIWTHNDGGTKDNNLYRLNSLGVVTKTINIVNAKNVDWEDLASDAGFNHLFIGDFGNNKQGRNNLRIYKCTYPYKVAGLTDTAEIINFTYPDQQTFPSTYPNFDCEAMVWYKNALYIFSKSKGKAYGWCKLYRIPDQAGTYVATLIDSFYTTGSITGAAIRTASKTLALITTHKILLFNDWSGSNFFTGTFQSYVITGSKQREGVSFKNDSTLYLISEKNIDGFETIDISKFIKSKVRETSPDIIPSDYNDDLLSSVSVFPNPLSNQSVLAYSLSAPAVVSATLFSQDGRQIKQLVNTPYDEGEYSINLDFSDALKPGYYFIHLMVGDKKYIQRILRL